jgi:hypothetical protein
MRTVAAYGYGEADWGYGCAHEFEWPATRVAGRVVGLVRATAGRTLRRCFGCPALLAGSASQIDFSARVLAVRSRTSAKFLRRSRLIGKKIIGRSMGLASGVGRRCPLLVRRSLRILRPLDGAVLASGGSFALLQQPARQHGGGIFLEPGIEQLRDLLAEVGGVAEPRELVTLQRVPRRGEKELPGWLGSVVQRGLQGKPRHSINIVKTVNGIHIRTYCGKLCKSLPANREWFRFTGPAVKAL